MLTFHFLLSARVVRVEDDTNRFMTRGEIYLETENGYFPCIGWGDRIISSVNMWISNTIKLLDPNYEELMVTNSFMDGPYSFEIQRTKKDRIAVKFIRQVGGVEKEEIPSLNMAFTDYCNALLKLVENMMSDPNFQRYGKEQERLHFVENGNLLKTWL